MRNTIIFLILAAVLQEAQRLLLEAVTATFYQAQLARENMILATSNWSFNKELESNAAKRWAVGDVPESDVLNFSVNAIQADVSYRASHRDFDLICTALAQLLALPDAKLPAERFPASDSALPVAPAPQFH